MKKALIAIGLLGLILLCGLYVKKKFNPLKTQLTKEWTEVSGHIKLDSLFAIDNISKVMVTNFYGTHTLTDKELKGFKDQLKGAKSRGGLEVKPGHISIELHLNDSTIVYAYGSTGQIHFDGGGFSNGFSASFNLPEELNYDNYR